MSAKSKKKLSKFPRAKITQALEKVIPNGQQFKVYVSDSKIGKMKVVRVVTPAWKSYRPAFRISRVLSAVDNQLTNKEKGNILRFSVLTPGEFKTVVGSRAPAVFKVPHHGAAKYKRFKRRRSSQSAGTARKAATRNKTKRR
jgi:hypothetical protein